MKLALTLAILASALALAAAKVRFRDPSRAIRDGLGRDPGPWRQQQPAPRPRRACLRRARQARPKPPASWARRTMLSGRPAAARAAPRWTRPGLA
jgi:hypothetical protein